MCCETQGNVLVSLLLFLRECAPGNLKLLYPCFHIKKKMHVPGESRGEKAMKHDDRVRMFLRKLTGPICLVRFWGSDAIVESVEGVEQ